MPYPSRPGNWDIPRRRQNDAYATRDVWLAAYLNTAGVWLDSVDRSDPNNVVFNFKARAINIERLVEEYFTGEARCNPHEIMANLKRFKAMLYHGQPELDSGKE